MRSTNINSVKTKRLVKPKMFLGGSVREAIQSNFELECRLLPLGQPTHK